MLDEDLNKIFSAQQDKFKVFLKFLYYKVNSNQWSIVVSLIYANIKQYWFEFCQIYPFNIGDISTLILRDFNKLRPDYNVN